MKPSLTAWAALVSLAVAAPMARAGNWLLDRNLELAAATNDNYLLTPVAPLRLNTVSLRGAGAATLRSDAESLRMDGAVEAVQAPGHTDQSRFDHDLRITRTLSLLRDTIEWQLRSTQDRTLQTAFSSADVPLGAGQHRALLAAVSGAHRISERWVAQGRVSVSHDNYARQLAGANDFRNLGGSGSLQWRLSETDTLTGHAGASRYARDDHVVRSGTSDIGLDYEHLVNELDRLTLGVGLYRTRTEVLSATLVCPLPVSFCRSGVVDYVAVQLPSHSTRNGTSLSLAWDRPLGERTRVAAQAQRSVNPSGVGYVTQTDRLSLQLGRDVAPQLSANLALGYSRSTYIGLDKSPQPRLAGLQLSMQQQLAPGLSWRLGAELNRSDEARARRSATAHVFNATLRYEWGPQGRAR